MVLGCSGCQTRVLKLVKGGKVGELHSSPHMLVVRKSMSKVLDWRSNLPAASSELSNETPQHAAETGERMPSRALRM